MNSETCLDSNGGSDCPFRRGQAYRVRCDFSALRDRFREGEILVYESLAYSRYDGIMGYFFRQEGRPEIRIWDLEDEKPISVWRDFFEEVPSV